MVSATGLSSVRKHKYNATKTVVDGITFASKAEAKRYAELKLLEKTGHIFDLKLQPVFELSVANMNQDAIGEYRADFSYWLSNKSMPFDHTKEQQRKLVEDVKGFKTPLYRWKKKHVEAQYGIKIVEIK
jgi:hypothetical protein